MERIYFIFFFVKEKDNKCIISDSSIKNCKNMSLNIDQILEKEKTLNKSEPWSKLFKSSKTQKLHSFAEKYGQKHNLSAKEVKELKIFLSKSLETKLSKTKDVLYNKDTQEVTDVPGLQQHPSSRAFTIRADTSKRPSTLKSLTPKRITERNRNTSNQTRAKEKQAKEDAEEAKEETDEKTEKN